MLIRKPTAPRAAGKVTPLPAKKKTDRSVGARWSKRLTEFCPVSSFFLANYHRLKPHANARALTSTEVLVVIHLMDFKWDKRAPHPAVGTIAKRMDITVRAVRLALHSLEEAGLVRRELSKAGGRTRYHFDGLIDRLHALMDADVAAKDKGDNEEGSTTDSDYDSEEDV